jgi:hypothetical protein
MNEKYRRYNKTSLIIWWVRVVQWKTKLRKFTLTHAIDYSEIEVYIKTKPKYKLTNHIYNR